MSSILLSFILYAVSFVVWLPSGNGVLLIEPSILWKPKKTYRFFFFQKLSMKYWFKQKKYIRSLRLSISKKKLLAEIRSECS